MYIIPVVHYSQFEAVSEASTHMRSNQGANPLLKNSLYLVMILIGLCTSSLKAQETLSAVQRDLDRVDKEIEREKDLHKT